jgi:hypothetical protein
MIIPHRELEWARRDPAAYADYLREKSEGKKGGGGGGFYGYWKIAATHYHKLSGDREAAVNHFVQLVKKNLNDNPRNTKKREEYVERLNAYFDDYESRGYYPFQFNKAVSVDLGSGVIMSGRIPRLDIVGVDGYAAFLFSRDCDGWEQELRFPLIQHRLSRELGCMSQNVSVGIYCLEVHEHLSLSFLQRQIDDAAREAEEVARAVLRLAGGTNQQE